MELLSQAAAQSAHAPQFLVAAHSQPGVRLQGATPAADAPQLSVPLGDGAPAVHELRLPDEQPAVHELPLTGVELAVHELQMA